MLAGQLKGVSMDAPHSWRANPASTLYGRWRLAALGAIALLCPSPGCSVYMAAVGSRDPDMGLVHRGATRGEIEMQLGSPIQTSDGADGGRVDVYEYEIGNEPSAGRAACHGVMDFLTLGIWELIGTPIEAAQGETYRATIWYDERDTVLSVNHSPD
ncbi:MAG TPA: hypothetical protein VMY35_17450 [Phycisphaerae bacterium]|nr:hypothetical protein [Phycisphaerae bacterium]